MKASVVHNRPFEVRDCWRGARQTLVWSKLDISGCNNLGVRKYGAQQTLECKLDGQAGARETSEYELGQCATLLGFGELDP